MSTGLELKAFENAGRAGIGGEVAGMIEDLARGTLSR
jgi:hypothetical protein